jgi:hypothetical protein
MNKILRAPVAFILMIALFHSCSKKGKTNDAGVCGNSSPKSFAADVNPIVQTFCNQPSCHNPGSVNGPGSLTNYSEVFNARAAVRSAIATGLMPKNATLTATQRNAIICWIDNGSANN